MLSARLRQAFDLFEAGVSMKRAAIRRAHPEADEDEVARRLRAWLRHRPGARYGDAVGRVRYAAEPDPIEPAAGDRPTDPPDRPSPDAGSVP